MYLKEGDVKDGHLHSLIIKKVVIDETGMITVRAKNPLGQMSASARLKITGEWASEKTFNTNTCGGDGLFGSRVLPLFVCHC